RRVAPEQEEAAQHERRDGQAVGGPADVAGQRPADGPPQLPRGDRGHEDADEEEARGRQHQAQRLDVGGLLSLTFPFPSALTHGAESTASGGGARGEQWYTSPRPVPM